MTSGNYSCGPAHLISKDNLVLCVCSQAPLKHSLEGRMRTYGRRPHQLHPGKDQKFVNGHQKSTTTEELTGHRPLKSVNKAIGRRWEMTTGPQKQEKTKYTRCLRSTWMGISTTQSSWLLPRSLHGILQEKQSRSVWHYKTNTHNNNNNDENQFRFQACVNQTKLHGSG